MELKQKWILLYARPYKMIEEGTGRINEGVSISYLTADNFSAVIEGDAKGIKPCKGSLPLELLNNITKVPAFYDFSLSMSTNSQGKPELRVKNISYASDILLK